MKNILIISYFFLPKLDVAAKRLGGLVKYLPEYGWKPIVLTPFGKISLNGNEITTIQTKEYDVINSLKKLFGASETNSSLTATQSDESERSTLKTIIYRIFKEIFIYPDAHKYWKKEALAKAEEYLNKNNVDCILSSSGPNTCHIIASELNKKYNIPWLADFRDLWTDNHYYEFSSFRKKIEKRLEKRTIQNANAIVTVSEPLSDILRNHYKSKNIFTIINGFDDEDIEFNQNDIKLDELFTITHTGNLYSGKRDPKLLFESIAELISEEQISKEDISINFYGPNAGWLNDMASVYHLEDVVSQKGFKDKESIRTVQRSSQLLLLLTWDNPNEKGVYTGKVFEYLATGRPIIATGLENGVLNELLMKIGYGQVFSKKQKMKFYLLEEYKEFKKSGFIQPRLNRNVLKDYTHSAMTKSFSSVLSKIT